MGRLIYAVGNMDKFLLIGFKNLFNKQILFDLQNSLKAEIGQRLMELILFLI
jgi:hypothetical protein